MCAALAWVSEVAQVVDVESRGHQVPRMFKVLGVSKKAQWWHGHFRSGGYRGYQMLGPGRVKRCF